MTKWIRSDAAVNACWVLLALVHAIPSAVLFSPALAEKLYSVAPDSDMALLLRHRGALFVCLVGVAMWALVDVKSRNLATVLLCMRVVSFLVLYLAAGAPAGALRTVATVDSVALLLIAVTAADAFSLI
jgi:hypothetical protein